MGRATDLLLARRGAAAAPPAIGEPHGMTVKPGMRTSEFAMMVATSALIAASDLFGLELDGETIAGVAALVVGYVVQRGYIKAQGAAVPPPPLDTEAIIRETTDRLLERLIDRNNRPPSAAPAMPERGP